MIARRILFAVLLACAGTAAAAVPPPPDLNHLRVSRLHIDYQVNADGSYVETLETVRQLNSEQAVRGGGQVRVPYSSSLDEFQVLEAYTLKRVGRRVAVPPGSVFVQDGLFEVSSQGITSFHDRKTSVLVYPELEPGDSIALRTRTLRRRPMLPGIFSIAHAFDGDQPYDDVSISVSAPLSLPLTVKSVGLDAVPPTDSGGRRSWRWTYRSNVIERTEDAAVDSLMYRPRLLVSSAASYAQIAAAAAQRFEGRAEVTPAIAAMAKQIVGDARSPEGEARRIQRWVAKNIRYFAVVLDVGGYIPRKADEVLSTRYGDCKDHAVILQALLAARGIRSVPALLTTDPLYELPEVPVMAAFNHVIVYIPSQKVFLESNGLGTSYGALPFDDTDKPVLMLGGGAGLPQRTPALRARDNFTRVSTRLVLRADGNASGEDSIRAGGASALYLADWASDTSQEDPVRVVRHFLLDADLVGEGTAIFGRFEGEPDFGYSMLYELRGYAERVARLRRHVARCFAAPAAAQRPVRIHRKIGGHRNAQAPFALCLPRTRAQHGDRRGVPCGHAHHAAAGCRHRCRQPPLPRQLPARRQHRAHRAQLCQRSAARLVCRQRRRARAPGGGARAAGFALGNPLLAAGCEAVRGASENRVS